MSTELWGIRWGVKRVSWLWLSTGHQRPWRRSFLEWQGLKPGSSSRLGSTQELSKWRELSARGRLRKLRVERPSGSAEGRRVPQWYGRDFVSSGWCTKMLFGSFSHLFTYLFSHGLVTYSIPHSCELDSLNSASHKASTDDCREQGMVWDFACKLTS